MREAPICSSAVDHKVVYCQHSEISGTLIKHTDDSIQFESVKKNSGSSKVNFFVLWISWSMVRTRAFIIREWCAKKIISPSVEYGDKCLPRVSETFTFWWYYVCLHSLSLIMQHLYIPPNTQPSISTPSLLWPPESGGLAFPLLFFIITLFSPFNQSFAWEWKDFISLLALYHKRITAA